MMDLELLHNAGIIPTLDVFDRHLSEAASLQNLPVTASLEEGSLIFRLTKPERLMPFRTGEPATLSLPLLHDIRQLPEDAAIAAIDEPLCQELADLAAAHPRVRWLPVGRFSAQQLADYMKSPFVWAVCDTSFMDTDAAGWNAKCRQARCTALGYAFAHMGIHNGDVPGCETVVNLLQNAFGFPSFDIGSSVIVAGPLEVTKSNPYGCCGHIGIETASVARAMDDLISKGFTLKEETIQHMPDGRLQSVYLSLRIGDFAVHLLQKR